MQSFGHYQRDWPGVAKTNGSKRRPKKGKKFRSGDPLPKWCSYHKTNSHSDSQCHKKKELKQLAAHLAELRSTDQARVANIGSAHLAQTSQPDPPSFGFSFSAMGASLVEAAASTTISGSTTANSPPNQQLLRHLHFNLDQFPRGRPSRIVACPKGPLVPSWRLPWQCRLLVSALATRLLRCWWIAERLTILSTRYSLPGCKT